MKKIRNIILIIADSLLVGIFLFVLVRARKVGPEVHNTKEKVVDAIDNFGANNTTDENIVSNGDNDVTTSAGDSTPDTDAEPAAMPDIKKNEEGLAGYDYCYVPYMNAEEVPEVSNWFSMDWEPYAAEAFSEHGELIIPQIKTRPLFFQDLTAPYYYDFTPMEGMGLGPDIDRMSYSELIEFFKKQNIGSDQLVTDNLAFISKVAKMQEENIIELEENKVYQIDMDLDGIMEEIEFCVIPVEHGKDYSVYINGVLMGTYRSLNRITLHLMDLGTCKVVFQYFQGWIARFYGFYDHTPLLLGDMETAGTLVALQNGLFIARGYCAPFQYRPYEGLFQFSHLYYVTAGQLYHLSFTASGKNEDWQQENEVWFLEEDLPYEKVDGTSGIMKKDTTVLVCGVNANRDLFLVNEDGQYGYIYSTFDEKYEAPIVNADGSRLSDYFAIYYKAEYCRKRR